MAKQEFEKAFDGFKDWSISNDILLLEGDFLQERISVLSIPYKDRSSIDTFKDLISRLKVEVIHYEFFSFEENVYERYKRLAHEESDLIDDFNSIKHLRGSILGFVLQFFKDGICYRIRNVDENAETFLRIKDTFSSILDEKEEEEEFEEELKKQEEYARLFVEHPKYETALNRPSRETLFKKLYPDIGRDRWMLNEVVLLAETIYKTEIKPKKEAELKKRIKELKSKGYKQVHIMAELEISKDTVSKYFNS